jgi:hypothetical protein
MVTSGFRLSDCAQIQMDYAILKSSPDTCCVVPLPPDAMLIRRQNCANCGAWLLQKRLQNDLRPIKINE